MVSQTPDNVVVAYPEQETFEIPHTAVRAFSDYCRTVKPVSALADRASFDVFQLRPWLGYIMILDAVPETDDFRYRMYGTRIAEQSGFDMTGKLVSAFDSPVGTFFAGLYRDCVAQ
ncbi:MAG: PAS domain-containing protein, partial [Gammaproteobacteria bacterium]